jgi:formylmethanofuran:tetrahydromethanopterin formyltransferase
LPYTTEEQEKLANIEAGAEVNKIESIVINGTTYDPVDKTVEITID